MKQNKQCSNKANKIQTHNKESLKELFSQLGSILESTLKYRLASRALSVLIIFALLMPFILLGNFSSVSAQSISSSSLLAQFSTPSINYAFGNGKSINFSPALAVSNSIYSVSNYVTAPTLPKGFESATPVSPFYQDVSNVSASAISSLGSVLGFFVNPSSTEATENAISDGAFPDGAVPFDLNGDGKANVSSWNPSTGEWKSMDNSGNLLTTVTLGSSSSTIVPGDFDGDGATDKAVWSAGTWTVKKSTDGTTVTKSMGSSGDIPVPGDYDGDGTTDYAVFITSTSTWKIESSSTSTITNTAFGTSGDIPVAGDYDDDDETDIAIFRPSTGVWHILGSDVGYYTITWGLAGDTPIAADFNGDNRSDYGIYRPSTGTWYVYYSDGVTSYTSEVWGNYGDQPVAADYDGDGKTDLSVWRPKTGLWLIKLSATSTYRYENLGITNDIPVPAAYVQKVGFQVPDYNMAKLRLEPKNATGGTNLYSRNFGWGTGLVGLPGRAGLNAGFGISYNSLIWIKDEANNSIHYNPDYSDITPGFKMGFPTIEAAYHSGTNPDTYSFLMVTPSGARVEFKQTAATDTYNSIDSSFTQLKLKSNNGPNDPPEDIGVTMATTDGTITEFEYKGGFYRVKKIKDRNGNYITVNHDEQGLLKTVTDTLGRVITVNYDAELYPTTIEQEWKTSNGAGPGTTTHTYATFSYTTHTMNANFDTNNLTVYGPTTGSIKVLDKITFADGSSTRFDYNGYGQVQKVNNYAADGTTKLNSVATNLDSITGTQTDVPKLSQQKSYVKDFNNDNEVVVNNTLSASTTTPSIPGESSESAKIIQVKMVNNPYDAATNIYVGDSDWNEGLPILTEDYIDVVGSSFTRKRWSFTKWEQDNETLTYAENPRAIRTKVGDDENSSVIRTEIDYLTMGALGDFNLPKEVRLFDNTTNTQLKKSTTTYEDSATYISKRIIGLPKVVSQLDNLDNLLAKVTYTYDGNNYTTETNQNISPVQHDTTNYGTSFNVGRGSVTKVTRHNVANSTTTDSELFYDVAGSPVASISPDPNNVNGRKITIDYTDSFNDNSNLGTYAYPTTITDPNGKSSNVIYRYDVGANIEAESPAPAGQTTGKVSKRIFDDSNGRLRRNSIYKGGNEHFYSRYVYPYESGNSYSQSASYSVLVAGQGEVESRNYYDGAGRVLKSRTPHRSTTSGTWNWAGSKVEYDILGRVTKTSVPKEVDSSFTPIGDDVSTDWLWNHSEYDWKNRVTRSIKIDGAVDSNGNPLSADNASDVKISYNGCGCAGSQITTIEGEEIIEKDWDGSNPNSLGRRTQKVYQDVLGRNWKTEVMEWNGTTPYLTTVNEFNGRDQITKVTQTDHSGTSDVSQVADITYDGFGRRKTTKAPQQGSATSYNYNEDDSIESMTDARGMVTAYTYNNRGLVTKISYDNTADSTIYDPDDVILSYDDLGNRTKMEDDMGETNYYYNQISQMTSETRTFDDTLANAPTGGFTVTYTYTLAGQLASIKDPFDDQINYSHDKMGRLTSVDGAAAFGTVTNYADNPHYRAWGALQSLEYGNGLKMEMTFNDRLQTDTFKLTDPTASETYMDKEYEYYSDGKLRKLNDKISYDSPFGGSHDSFDRLTTYDNMGRPKLALSGANARSGQGTVAQADKEKELPYEQSYSFNAFNNMTARTNEHWGKDNINNNSFDISHPYLNNRIDISSWVYDADGRVTKSFSNGDEINTEYDTKGQLTRYYKPENSDVTRYYDGSGAEVKRNEQTYSEDENGNGSWEDKIEYFIRSSVLGNQVISKVSDTGRKTRTYVRAAGAVLAWQNQSFYNNTVAEYVKFEYTDASGLSKRSANKDGTVFASNFGGAEGDAVERDPLSGNVGASSPYFTLNTNDPDDDTLEALGDYLLDSLSPSATTYNLDGFSVPSWVIGAAARAGGLAIELTDGSGHTLQFPVFETLGSIYFPTNIRYSNIEGEVIVESTSLQWINLGIPQLQTMTPKQLLSQAVNDALSALNTRESCRNLFSGDPDPEATLRNLYEAPNPDGGYILFGDLGAYIVTTNNDGTETRRGTAAITRGLLNSSSYSNNANGARVFRGFSGASVRINSNPNGPFILGAYDFLGVGATDRIYRALFILHELGHAVDRIFNPAASQIVDDVSGADNRANSQAVYDNCFAPITTPSPTQ